MLGSPGLQDGSEPRLRRGSWEGVVGALKRERPRRRPSARQRRGAGYAHAPADLGAVRVPAWHAGLSGAPALVLAPVPTWPLPGRHTPA